MFSDHEESDGVHDFIARRREAFRRDGLWSHLGTIWGHLGGPGVTGKKHQKYDSQELAEKTEACR